MPQSQQISTEGTIEQTRSQSMNHTPVPYNYEINANASTGGRLRAWLTSISVLVVLAGAATICSAATINVPGDYATIQGAVNAASPGDTIVIAAGTYSENILISKRLVLQGAGSGNTASDTIITSAAASTPVITMNAGGDNSGSRFVFQNLRVTGATGSASHAGSGITLQPGVLGFITFDNVSVVGNSGNGIDIDLFALLNDIIIRNSNLSQNGGSGFRAPASCAGVAGLEIADSHLDGNSEGGLTAYSAALTNWNIHGSTFDDNAGPVASYGMYIEGHTVTGLNIDCSEFNRNKDATNAASAGLVLSPAANGDIYSNITITHSRFNNNPNYGLILQMFDGSLVQNIALDCDDFKANGWGIVAVSYDTLLNGVATGFTVHNSNIAGNTNAGIDNASPSLIDATSNWWGAASGPSGIGAGTGDAIINEGSGSVLFTPFRTTVSSCPTACTPAPSISIVKKTNGTDNDTAPGPYVPVGSTVNWTYDVTNSGNVTLTNVVVTDDQGVTVTCPKSILAADETMTCTASSIAVAGQYTNTGSVKGTPPSGPDVTASNVDHYFGSQPSVKIVKYTNGQDANTAPGPYIPVGSTVSWTYVVTNTGNVPLTNVTVTDDHSGVTVSCPSTSLATGASMTCTASGTAVAGQYTNLGSVKGTPPVGSDVTSTDPSNYFGSNPSIQIVKTTNGTDNDSAPGPTVYVGSTVTWRYTVTNNGNVTLTSVAVTDDKVGAITCPATSLAPGASMTCVKTGTAIAGQYTNVGSVKGTPPVGANVTASNPDHYFGISPCTGKIGDFVWNDLNANGIQDSGEPGIGGVAVQLKSGSTVLQTTTTSSSGYYQFTAVCAGTYTVLVATPAGFSPTQSLKGTNRSIDSNGSPATVTLSTSSSTDLTIDFGFVKFATGYTTYTMGGWGAVPSGTNPGWLLKTYFSKVYPGGSVTVGGTKYLKFTSAYAIQVFLPAGGTPGVLTSTLTNPTSSPAGTFASQVLALRLNVDFSNAGLKKTGLGNLRVISGPLAGYTVNQVLSLANSVLGGNTGALPSGLTVAGLTNILDLINSNFDNGTTNNGYLY
jgi:uncharacterized repeat protein (TIGR01451 family)